MLYYDLYDEIQVMKDHLLALDDKFQAQLDLFNTKVEQVQQLVSGTAPMVSTPRSTYADATAIKQDASVLLTNVTNTHSNVPSSTVGHSIEDCC